MTWIWQTVSSEPFTKISSDCTVRWPKMHVEKEFLRTPKCHLGSLRAFPTPRGSFLIVPRGGTRVGREYYQKETATLPPTTNWFEASARKNIYLVCSVKSKTLKQAHFRDHQTVLSEKLKTAKTEPNKQTAPVTSHLWQRPEKNTQTQDPIWRVFAVVCLGSCWFLLLFFFCANFCGHTHKRDEPFAYDKASSPLVKWNLSRFAFVGAT